MSWGHLEGQQDDIMQRQRVYFHRMARSMPSYCSMLILSSHHLLVTLRTAIHPGNPIISISPIFNRKTVSFSQDRWLKELEKFCTKASTQLSLTKCNVYLGSPDNLSLETTVPNHNQDSPPMYLFGLILFIVVSQLLPQRLTLVGLSFILSFLRHLFHCCFSGSSRPTDHATHPMCYKGRRVAPL